MRELFEGIARDPLTRQWPTPQVHFVVCEERNKIDHIGEDFVVSKKNTI